MEQSNLEQNINLLEQPVTPQSYRHATIKIFLFLIIVFNALLLLIYFVSFGLYKKQELTLEQLVLAKESAIKEVSALQEKITSKLPEASSVKLAGSVTLPTLPSFASYLEKLALSTPYGIWLNSIKINQKGGGLTFSLAGKSVASPLVPLFVKNLGRRNVFNGKLVAIKLQKDEKLNLTSFTLDNVVEVEK